MNACRSFFLSSYPWPILWRYLLKSYFQVLFLCVGGFIGLLLVTRFQEIARFASATNTPFTVFLFTLYQIPYILPIALPISCLIGALLLFQRLSLTHELTALRAAGLGFPAITLPLWIGALFLALINFTIASEIAPLSRAQAQELIYKTVADNPLILLQKKTIFKLKDAYLEMELLEEGKRASNVLFILPDNTHPRLNILTAKELYLRKESLEGKGVSFISNIDAKTPAAFDHLLIENQLSMQMRASPLAQLFQKMSWRCHDDFLSLKLLRAKAALHPDEAGRCRAEISRRISLGLAVCTFTVIGVSFGIHIGRSPSKKGIFWAMGLATAFLVCFLSAKSLKRYPVLSCIAYLIPHLPIVFFSLRFLHRANKGMET